ncbi:hypothetical protein GCM10023185_40090 [Hymenobacter saemangeumensis]|uniref:Uncharacterized protein n=1 Tax=Hymenobacter saemangeumensis TaxID=1084522 RepID=A0ABP8IQY7_9BACT
MPVIPRASRVTLSEARPSELDALRAELRCILQHPAIAPWRRQAAEPFIGQCSEPARLRHWLALAVAECGRWEERTLAEEGNWKNEDGLPG